MCPKPGSSALKIKKTNNIKLQILPCTKNINNCLIKENLLHLPFMIQLLFFIIIYPLIMLISILPFRILYLFSDLLSFIVFNLIGYRKNVILNNLKVAFPDKSLDELKMIRKTFYRHFTDLYLEAVKTLTMSPDTLLKRVRITNENEFKEFFKKHQNVILMSSHHCNYEWLISVNAYMEQPLYLVYKKLENKYFNWLMKRSRSKLGATLVPTKDIINVIREDIKNDRQGSYGFLSDQNPLLNKASYWRKFFGVRVPVFTGTELLSKRYDLPVIFLRTRKVKRGYYEITMEVISENSKDIKFYQITDRFFELLENQIKEQPEYYFWTHKRFKHAGKEPSKKAKVN